MNKKNLGFFVCAVKVVRFQALLLNFFGTNLLEIVNNDNDDADDHNGYGGDVTSL